MSAQGRTQGWDRESDFYEEDEDPDALLATYERSTNPVLTTPPSDWTGQVRDGDAEYWYENGTLVRRIA